MYHWERNSVCITCDAFFSSGLMKHTNMRTDQIQGVHRFPGAKSGSLFSGHFRYSRSHVVTSHNGRWNRRVLLFQFRSQVIYSNFCGLLESRVIISPSDSTARIYMENFRDFLYVRGNGRARRSPQRGGARCHNVLAPQSSSRPVPRCGRQSSSATKNKQAVTDHGSATGTSPTMVLQQKTKKR